MKVKVIVHDVCDKPELDTLVNESCGLLQFEYSIMSDGRYDVICNMQFDKCSFIKYVALKNYARKKQGKVKVVKL